MDRFIKVLRGSAPVSDSQANAVFDLLIPIVEQDPTAPDAVEAARSVIARCVPTDDGALASVLDWWFIATTGETSANGGAHRLPEWLDDAVRLPMEAAMRLDTELPLAEWLEKRWRLESDLRDLDNILSLDHYGPSKVPRERVAWSWLQEQLDPAVSALRGNRPAASVEIGKRQLHNQLRDNDVEQGSRRWREMLKRCDEAIDRVNAMVRLQGDVQPWVRRPAPTVLQSVPAGVIGSIEPLAPALLRPLLAANAAPAIDRSDLAGRLGGAARSTDQAGRYRLARIVDSWCQQTGHEVPALVEVIERHRRVQEGLQALVENDDIDTDNVQVCIAEDDLGTAETELAKLRIELERREDIRRTRSHLEGLRRRVLGADLGDDSEWHRRLDDLAGRLDSSDPQDLAREIDDARRELSDQLNESRRVQVKHLRDLLDRLEQLDAPASVLFDWRKETNAVEAQPAGPDGRELVLELEDEIERIRRERRESVERRISTVEKVLTDERGDFTEADAGDFVKRRTEIEALLDDPEVSDAELVGAGTVAEALLRDLEKHRIHQWTASEGEASLVEHLIEYCTGSLDFDPEDIRRLHVALKTKPFVILAGLTGSGKSSLTRLYAEAVGARSGSGQFRRVAVRPDWIDQSEVLGFVNPVSHRFVPGWLAETVRRCERSPDRLHFVLLDEMNLAPVEQYLAELLSAMEEARSGSLDVQLPLYSRGEKPENVDEWPPDLRYPDNLIIVGTVNVDETTRPLSERVIDRANVLHLSVKLSERHHGGGGRSKRPWHVSTTDWRKVSVNDPSPDHHEFLVDVADILRRANIGVGLRAHVELERFLANAKGIIDPEPALDWGIVQRIIPKIRGFKGPLTEALQELSEEFNKVGSRQSAAIVERWLSDSFSDDEYLDGTDPRLTLART